MRRKRVPSQSKSVQKQNEEVVLAVTRTENNESTIESTIELIISSVLVRLLSDAYELV